MSHKPGASYRPADPSDLVSDEILLEKLIPMLGSSAIGPEFELVERTLNVYASSCPSEIVRLKGAGGGSIELFCKYDFQSPEGHVAHRRGVAYESRIYEKILIPLKARVPTWFGCFDIPGQAGHSCLVVECVDNTMRVDKAGAARLRDAASWIGSFHRQASQLLEDGDMSFLIRYEENQMRSFMDRVMARATTPDLAWTGLLAERYKALLDEVDPEPETVIHGEYYPKNILATASDVYPIDWESAGVGAGEIDLASLTLGWPKQHIEECIDLYAQHRWPDGSETCFRSRVQIAAIYLCLRMFIEHDPDSTKELHPKLLDFLRHTAFANGFLDSGEA